MMIPLASIESVCVTASLAGLSLGMASAIVRGVMSHSAWRQVTMGTYALAALCLLAALAARSLASATLALSTMYDSLLFVTLALLSGYILFTRYLRASQANGAFEALWAWPVGLLALGAVSLAATLPHDVAPLIPALQSYWRLIHVPVILAAYATLSLTFAGAVVLLVLAARNAGSQTLRVCDNLCYRGVSVGFPMLALGVMLGALWANEAWGRYWSWDPKESMSLATLLVYGAYLHLRVRGHIGPIALAWVLVGGFAMVMLTYFGLNALGVGLHTYGSLGGK